MPEPFPALVQGRLGIPIANLGCVNAGIDVFLNEPAIADVAAGARVTVLMPKSWRTDTFMSGMPGTPA